LFEKHHQQMDPTMKTCNCLSLIILSLCAVFATGVAAQDRPRSYDSFPLLSPDNEMEEFSSKLRGRSDFSNVGRQWVAELEQAGIVNRSLRGPYRVAVPLMSFGPTGPKLMITYARKIPGTNDDGVFLFIHIPTE
jgi:hypothetical protein